jgi:hypothetical protein
MLTGHSSIVKRQTAPQLTSRPQSRRAGGAADILVVADVPMAPGELDVREPAPSELDARRGRLERQDSYASPAARRAGGRVHLHDRVHLNDVLMRLARRLLQLSGALALLGLEPMTLGYSTTARF